MTRIEKTYDEIAQAANDYDVVTVELKAQQLRSAYVAEGLRNAAAWVGRKAAALRHGGHGQAA